MTDLELGDFNRLIGKWTRIGRGDYLCAAYDLAQHLYRYAEGKEQYRASKFILDEVRDRRSEYIQSTIDRSRI